MSNAMLSLANHPVSVALEAMSTAISDARESDIWALSDDSLESAILECEKLAARQQELALALVREADDRDLGRRLGATSTMGWLRDKLRLRPGVAKGLVDLAHRLQAGTTVVDWATDISGNTRGAMPATAAAMAEGAVSHAHAKVIAQVMDRIPDHVDDAEAARAEGELAGYARQYDPRTLARLGEHMLHVMDVDTLANDEEKASRKRELRINDETGRITGRLDREGLATLRSALDPLAKPNPADDGTQDTRTPPQRMGDALVELARQACDRGDLPAQRGARPHLMLFADIETLSQEEENAPGSGSDAGRRRGCRAGELIWGGPISADAVRRIACDAAITRVLFAGTSVPMDVGREYRTVTPGQFAALVARDGGCAFPGCTRPPAWCEAHHIEHWADGGVTALCNLVLLCGHHHRSIHHRGWEVCLGEDGLPEFIPPAWVDPDRRPRRNNRPRFHRSRSPG